MLLAVADFNKFIELMRDVKDEYTKKAETAIETREV
tara:strand:+ start:481 stop:588 length:108 start_codon:yes stop_codon:yes gene_type:complete